MVQKLDEIISRHPDLQEFYDAPSGVGERANEWKDKPHRLVYDLIRLVINAREKPVPEDDPDNDYARGM